MKNGSEAFRPGAALLNRKSAKIVPVNDPLAAIAAKEKPRLCIVEPDYLVLRSLTGTFEMDGFEVLGIGEVIGAPARISGFGPEAVLISAQTSPLDRFVRVLKKNLPNAPRILVYGAGEEGSNLDTDSGSFIPADVVASSAPEVLARSVRKALKKRHKAADLSAF